MTQKIIACESVKEEIIALNPQAKMEFLEYSLHNTPDILKKELQKRIEVETEADTILLGYGLCSNAVDGLYSEKHTIVIPRVHDCIAMLMGSAGQYSEAFTELPNTYYLSRGWIDYGNDPMKEYHRYLEKYGKENSGWMIDQIYKSYKRIVFIDTGVSSRKHIEYAKQVAGFMQWDYEEITGSSNLLTKLILGPWDQDFLVVPPKTLVEQQNLIGIVKCMCR